MASILVTDGEERAALAVTRSLGRSGHAVHIAASRNASLAGASRYARSETRTPHPLEEPREFFMAVQDIIERRQIQLLLPISEAALLAILPRRSLLSEVCLPFPSYQSFEKARNKHTVLHAAGRVGLSVPRQQTLCTPADREGLNVAELEYPLVLKPSHSVVQESHRLRKWSVLHVDTADALLLALDRIPMSAYPILLQERILGPGIGVFLLLWRDQLLASFGHRRLREKPPAGGVSVYRESVTPSDELVDLSRRLLDELRWEGVGMVEYKVQASTGRPYLMEVNPRFWGSLQLAIDAGVDFPAILVAAALGEAPREISTARRNVRSRWLWGDVDHLVARLRHSKRRLSLPEDAPGRWRVVLDFVLAFSPGTRLEVLRLTDPLPFLRETADWLRNLGLSCMGGALANSSRRLP